MNKQEVMAKVALTENPMSRTVTRKLPIDTKGYF